MRLAVALVGILGATALAAPRAPHPGKVVRVERRPHGISGVPRYCTFSPSDITGYCITSKPPDVGDHMAVVDSTRQLGTVRITTVTPLGDGCQQGMTWMINGTLETGDISQPQGQVLGLFDVPLDAHGGRFMMVDHSPGGHSYGIDTVYGVDTNGDSNPDIEFAQFACDDGGNATTAAPTGACYEVWAATAATRFERIRQERLRNCY